MPITRFTFPMGRFIPVRFQVPFTFCYPLLFSCSKYFSISTSFFTSIYNVHCHIRVYAHVYVHFHFRSLFSCSPSLSTVMFILISMLFLIPVLIFIFASSRHEIPYKVNHRPYQTQARMMPQNRMRSAWNPIQSESPATLGTISHEAGMKSHTQ